MVLAIETWELTKRFNGVTVVDGLNLAVPEGSVFGLVGPNGAGKTTTIKMLLGLLQPTRGSAWVLGHEAKDAVARHRIGYVPDTQKMYPWFRVEEIFFLCSGFYQNWDWGRVKHLQSKFNLPVESRILSLSQGTTTLVALTIALSIRPRLLILDEPTTGLDPIKRRQLLQLVLEEVAGEGTTVFLSTHHLGDLERLADQIALLDKGRLVFCQDMDDLKRSFRRIQTVFPGGLPAELSRLPGVLKVESTEHVCSLIVNRDTDRILARVREFNPAFVEVQDLSLDEIFYYAVGGEQRV